MACSQAIWSRSAVVRLRGMKLFLMHVCREMNACASCLTCCRDSRPKWKFLLLSWSAKRSEPEFAIELSIFADTSCGILHIRILQRRWFFFKGDRRSHFNFLLTSFHVGRADA